ncbi:hypothetical protein OsI_05889 [Oryza sativa Indica Group]|uniref:Uncharacterized protein n=2 Tax=Oryza sativa TaxID=4530 RepID=A3A385_ORYSJ|nr:hypothetical protein OsI_05889 [Oryza sativa Indica Group]EAZ21774.1 hypothetical protein OsJ_05411 [Oryza sativa Japonica Group]
MSSPGSLLLLTPAVYQGIGRNRGGQSQEGQSISSSRSLKTKLSVSARAVSSCEASMFYTVKSFIDQFIGYNILILRNTFISMMLLNLEVQTRSSNQQKRITCCANQTQTARRKSFSGPTSPPSGSVKEKVRSPKLDDGGTGFPPFRFGGGGGGGGGGGSNSAGGFILFVIVLLLDYLREFERNLQNGTRRGSDYDNGLAPQ